MLYPAVSNLVNEKHQSSVIAGYKQEADAIGAEQRAAELRKAQQYNAELLSMLSVMETDEIEHSEEYLNRLNLSGSGVMGSIDIDKINVHLPIYHGTSDSVLQVGAGHLAVTSLPVGGGGTHAIISAHTGLPSAKLFTDLDELKTGDMFKINVLDEILVYKVDQIKVVEPYDTADMRIFEGKDYVTLLTCTPYGINTHRLLVRGVRIPYEEAEKAGLFVEIDAVYLDKTLLIPFAVIPADLVCIFLILSKNKIRKKRQSDFFGQIAVLLTMLWVRDAYRIEPTTF